MEFWHVTSRANNLFFKILSNVFVFKFRHILIRKQTHQSIIEKVNVTIILRGVYKPPGVPDPAPLEKKLHLLIRSESIIELRKAIEMVEEISLKGSLSLNLPKKVLCS